MTEILFLALLVLAAAALVGYVRHDSLGAPSLGSLTPAAHRRPRLDRPRA